MFWTRLQELRKRAKMSQVALGDKLGVSQQTIWKWESGINEPGNDKLVAIADHFCVSTDYLLGRTDDPKVSHHDLRLTDNNKASLLTTEKNPPTPEEREQVVSLVENALSAGPQPSIVQEYPDLMQRLLPYIREAVKAEVQKLIDDRSKQQCE